MPEPTKYTKFVEKDRVDITLDGIIEQTQKSGKITQSQFNQAFISASIHDGIERYRAEAAGMTLDQLENEKHASKLLAKHLHESGFPRPPNCHAHAIVSGSHKDAIRLRLMMSHLRMRIDDPANGCWLPENTAATPHPKFPKAIPHSRVHRYNYYWWLNTLINVNFVRDFDDLCFHLKRVITALQTRKGLPNYVMNKKGKGLPA